MSAFLDEVRADLLADDAERPRSQQIETGGSQLLGCRAEAVLRLNGVPQSDPRMSWQAFVGSAIDERLGAARLRRRPWLMVQHRTVYGGVPFSVDEYDPQTKALSDWKTKDNAAACAEALKYVKDRQRAQIHGGAAGLRAEGFDVETVRLVFIPRAGSMDGARVFEEPFSQEWADRGVEWAAEIGDLAERIGVDSSRRVADSLDGLRDEMPSFCSSYCPYFTVCRGAGESDTANPDPVVLETAQRYTAAWIEAKEAEARRDYYKEQLAGQPSVVTDGWKVGWSRDTRYYEDEPDLSAVDVAAYEAIVGALPRKPVMRGKSPSLTPRKVRK